MTDDTRQARQMLLTVFAPHYCASAIYERTDDSGEWRCTKCAPIIHWLASMPLDDARRALRQKGLPYKWLALE